MSTEGSNNLGNLAHQLKSKGFSHTPIARAVQELLGTYLGMHAKLSPSIQNALQKANEGVGANTPKRDTEGASNDPIFHQDTRQSA